MRALFTILLLVASIVARAAPVVQATVHAANAGNPSLTCTGVNASLGNAVVSLITTRESGGLTLSTATWNGSTDTPDESSAPAAEEGVQSLAYAWQGLTGTASLVMSFTGSVTDIEGWCIVLSGVDTADIIGTPSTAPVNLTSPVQATVSGDTNDLVLSEVRVRAAQATAGVAELSGQTLLDGPQDAGNGNSITLSSEPGGASVTSGYSGNFGSPNFLLGQVLVINVNGTGSSSGLLLRRRRSN